MKKKNELMRNPPQLIEKRTSVAGKQLILACQRVK